MQTESRNFWKFIIVFQGFFGFLIYNRVSQNFQLADPFWFLEITKNSHSLAHINKEYPDAGYPKLNIYILELILDSYQYIVTAACVKIRCMIWPYLSIVSHFLGTEAFLTRYSNGHKK
jgi:hypothetical protein